MKLIRQFRTQLNALWANDNTKRAVIVSGTLLGVGVFYWPFISSLLYPPKHMTPEQISFYNKDNYYLAKKSKQLQEENRQKQLRGKELQQQGSLQLSEVSQPEGQTSS